MLYFLLYQEITEPKTTYQVLTQTVTFEDSTYQYRLDITETHTD